MYEVDSAGVVSPLDKIPATIEMDAEGNVISDAVLEEMSQLRGRAEVAEAERDALAQSYKDIRDSLRGLLAAMRDAGSDDVADEIASILDSE